MHHALNLAWYLLVIFPSLEFIVLKVGFIKAIMFGIGENHFIILVRRYKYYYKRQG